MYPKAFLVALLSLALSVDAIPHHNMGGKNTAASSSAVAAASSAAADTCAVSLFLPSYLIPACSSSAIDVVTSFSHR